jgi:hypothetical protein
LRLLRYEKINVCLGLLQIRGKSKEKSRSDFSLCDALLLRLHPEWAATRKKTPEVVEQITILGGFAERRDQPACAVALAREGARS